MDIKRVILYGALALMGYFLWMNWQTDYPQMPAPPVETRVMPSQAVTNPLAPPGAAGSTAETIPVTAESAANENVSASRVYVTTDVLNLAIDLKQGDIVNTQLLAYPESADPQSKPMTLLQDNPTTQYVANSGLVVLQKQVVQSLDVPYTTQEKNYELNVGQEQLVVTLKGETSKGLVVTKTFSF